MKFRTKMITPDELQILVCCHNSAYVPDDPYLMPIYAGAALTGTDLKMQRDDKVNNLDCENISLKNPNYCELTVLYWAWKNLKQIKPSLKYIGLNHYRRYFDFEKPNRFQDMRKIHSKEIGNYKVNIALLSRILREDKTVVAKKMQHPYTVFDEYAVTHNGRDLCELIGVLHENDASFDDAVIDSLLHSNAFSRYNMFITRWDIFNEYCNWLFKILDNIQNRIDISHYNSYQARVFGFMAERLWNVWLKQQGVKTKEIPIIWLLDQDTRGVLPRSVNIVRRRLAYSLSSYSREYAKRLHTSIINDAPRP